MSDMLNAALSFSHASEAMVSTIQTSLGLASLFFITDPCEPDDYPCVRYEESSGGPDSDQQYTLVKLSIKTNAGKAWTGRQILAKLLEGIGLHSLQPVFEAYMPEKEWASAAPNENNPALTGDHLRVTPHSASLWQTVSDDPEIYHVALTLRIYHD